MNRRELIKSTIGIPGLALFPSSLFETTEEFLFHCEDKTPYRLSINGVFIPAEVSTRLTINGKDKWINTTFVSSIFWRKSWPHSLESYISINTLSINNVYRLKILDTKSNDLFGQWDMMYVNNEVLVQQSNDNEEIRSLLFKNIDQNVFLGTGG